jgi:hypothetical protein
MKKPQRNWPLLPLPLLHPNPSLNPPMRTLTSRMHLASWQDLPWIHLLCSQLKKNILPGMMNLLLESYCIENVVSGSREVVLVAVTTGQLPPCAFSVHTTDAADCGIWSEVPPAMAGTSARSKNTTTPSFWMIYWAPQCAASFYTPVYINTHKLVLVLTSNTQNP